MICLDVSLKITRLCSCPDLTFMPKTGMGLFRTGMNFYGEDYGSVFCRSKYYVNTARDPL